MWHRIPILMLSCALFSSTFAAIEPPTQVGGPLQKNGQAINKRVDLE